MPNHAYATTRRLRDAGRVDEPLDLGWVWSSTEPVGDLVMTADGTRLTSPRVKEIFDSQLGSDDVIQWLPGTVTSPDTGSQPYWVLRFPVHHDLLNRELSTFGPSGLPIHAVFSQAKLSGHAVTAQAGSPLTTIVARRIVDELATVGAIGVTVMDLPVGP
jgi:hypothetical protein